MNREFGWILAGLLAPMVLGCDVSPVPVERAHVGPHNAILHGLPGDMGFVEVVNEPEVTDRRRPPNTAIVVYFLQPDQKTALATVPAGVQVVLEKGRKKAETVPLKSDARSDDPAGGCRFITKMGPYVLEGLQGKLSGTLDGKTFDLDLGGGR